MVPAIKPYRRRQNYKSRIHAANSSIDFCHLGIAETYFYGDVESCGRRIRTGCVIVCWRRHFAPAHQASSTLSIGPRRCVYLALNTHQPTDRLENDAALGLGLRVKPTKDVQRPGATGNKSLRRIRSQHKCSGAMTKSRLFAFEYWGCGKL